jgi:hypothetical protein
MQYRIERRKHYEVNTDGRCYNGAHWNIAKNDLVDHINKETTNDKLD